MLLLRDDALQLRRAAARPGGPLAPLAESLAAELSPWLGRAPFIPEQKALLSRLGGRCERCGAVLEFDPASPREHRCGSCEQVHRGELHDRAWIMPYQLWLAERAVHGAILYLLRGDMSHALFAREVLHAYADRYTSYPNQDNVLGPSRLFFSTYLESIWLLQICIAVDLLAAAGQRDVLDRVRDRIIEPGRALIAVYDEGASNRQVWNNAALLAAAILLRRETDIESRAHGASGTSAHLAHALLPDGTWYEGENYHQFALRGLWYCVSLLELGGNPPRQELIDRFERAFAAPFLTSLPDFTMPSRKDSQYAVSLRQWRIAEQTELGFARRRDPLLGGALARLYGDPFERRDTGRSRSTADVERNAPPSALTRADLGWRALLHALPELPPVTPIAPRSTMLSSQGYAVFRREGGIYVGFEFGQSGGGHGHPDRLNVTLCQHETRWLDDLGTGSYVDPSLHWYRSTLAHNAPLVNGTSQPLRDATLQAYDEREALGWIVGEFDVPDAGVRLERAIVVTPDYFVDEIRWNAATEVCIQVPWHLGYIDWPSDTRFAVPETGRGQAFSYLEQMRKLAGAVPTLISVQRDGRSLHVAIVDAPAELLAADAPGQPFDTRHEVIVVCGRGSTGRLRTITSWAGPFDWSANAADDTLAIRTETGEDHVHRRDANGWHVELRAASARSSIDLAGFRATAMRPQPSPDQHPMASAALQRRHIEALWATELTRDERALLLVVELGESHYRRSEPTWREAGSPSATVWIGASAEDLVFFFDVRAGDPIFTPRDADNPYDNEQADTMRAGVQLYLDVGHGMSGWMLVPETESGSVRVRHIVGDVETAPVAHWRRTSQGYELTARAPGAARESRIGVDALINETVRGRERRRGQLVMSGARGEFVYLRGDRHEADRLVPLVILP